MDRFTWQQGNKINAGLNQMAGLTINILISGEKANLCLLRKKPKGENQ